MTHLRLHSCLVIQQSKEPTFGHPWAALSVGQHGTELRTWDLEAEGQALNTGFAPLRFVILKGFQYLS